MQLNATTDISSRSDRTRGQWHICARRDGDEDFLTRERAALGEDAAIFATPGDNTATVQDADDDLLGGGDYGEGQAGGEDMTEFESSFPAVDTRNDVRCNGQVSNRLRADPETANGSRRNNHRL